MISQYEWHNAKFIISARLVSDFGAFLNMVALSTYVYTISNSVVNVSVFLACRVAGGIIASIFGVPFFRRFYGRSSLICFDLLRVIMLSTLLFTPQDVQSIILPFIALGIGIGNSMFAIGLNSQLPHWIHESQIISTNAWLTSVSATGAVAGSLVSGLMVAASGYNVVFIVNIITYLIAAGLIMPLRFVNPPDKKTYVAQHHEWAELAVGLRHAPMLAGMLLVSMTDTLGSAAHNVGFPILSKLISPDDAARIMGILLSVWALGKFSGARIANIMLRERGNKLNDNIFFAGVAIMSLGFIFTFQQSAVLWALLLILWAGIGDGLAEVSLISRVQNEPENLRLPVFSLLTLLQMTGFGIGMLIVAPFYVWLPPSLVIIIFHGLPLSTLLIVLLTNRYVSSNKTDDRERSDSR